MRSFNEPEYITSGDHPDDGYEDGNCFGGGCGDYDDYDDYYEDYGHDDYEDGDYDDFDRGDESASDHFERDFADYESNSELVQNSGWSQDSGDLKKCKFYIHTCESIVLTFNFYVQEMFGGFVLSNISLDQHNDYSLMIAKYLPGAKFENSYYAENWRHNRSLL